MTQAARQLLNEAKALDASDRARMALVLLRSLDGPEETDWQESWSAELDERAATLDAER